ncbi:MAG TPA: condensation domain-containing protein, partial [Ktedonobacterales bacterium]|nr:condensation domain-containing protein [Ktedonobacterales bacterium]
MAPSTFVMLKQLPLTPNGKLDRKALPAPDTARPDLARGYTPPSTPVEEALAKIWAEVLRLQQVGIHDNFFELGGDSILSIQIIARANAAGLRLTPRQVFQHQSIATLAAVAGTEALLNAQQGAVSGEVALTPIQHWFFQQERIDAHHFNQARLLILQERLSPQLLKQLASALVAHHDALRLRFVRTPHGWQQSNAAEETHAFFSEVDLSDTDPPQRSAAITAACTQLQSSLDLQQGPLLRVCYFEMGPQERARLLLVIHHLCVDAVSWRVLLEDLASGIAQLSRGEELALPAKTTSFQAWAHKLAEYASSPTLLSERAYWQEVLEADVAELAVDYAGGANTAASQGVVRVELEAEQTRALLSEVPSVYHTHINDALLSALARSVSWWSGERRVRVDLEGHGREALFEGVDVSRTVGWFTSLYPVLLEVPSSSDWGECLKGVKEQLRGVPKRGLGYGVLRYLCSDADMRESVSGGSGAQISFNYHGHLDIDGEAAGAFLTAAESVGAVRSPLAQRTHLLDIVGHVAQGRLHVAFFYSDALHSRSTVQELAHTYLQGLRELIAHCQSAQAGGYTPSDFPRATLSQAALDHLLAGLGALREDPIEDLYPLSPMQSGMLFHCLYAQEHAVYVDHLLYTLHGDVDPLVFERAWQVLIARHSLLRTSFHWQGLEEALQVVHRSARTPLDVRDWRDLSDEEQERALGELRKEDRGKGLDLGSAPLMRLTLLRRGSQRWELLWSVHHLVVDRWSIGLLMGELGWAYEALHAGELPALPASRPYSDYIDWLQQQEQARAQTYWRGLLSGFTTPTALPLDKTPGAVAGGRMPARALTVLSEARSAALQSLARRHHLTFNTLVQGAWALLLSRYSGEVDVVFGATVSGRPASLRGVERMAGMFINSLPVRVRVRGKAGLLEWLEELQGSMLELREYEYSSLTQVQSWSEVPRGVALFDSLVVVQNTPVVQRGEEAGSSASLEGSSGELRLGTLRSDSSADFPLYLTAAPDVPIRLALNYDPSRYEAGAIA